MSPPGEAPGTEPSSSAPTAHQQTKHAQEQQQQSPTPVTALPPNVSIFSPSEPTGARNLLSGRVFTRLTVSSGVEHGTERLASALKVADAKGAFSFAHGRAALVFDGGEGEEEEAVMDEHHEHVRVVCLALRDADLGLDIAGCVFDAREVVRSGFQVEGLSGGAVMVVDIMGGEDGDDEEEGEDDDEDGDLEDLLKGGVSGEVV